MERPTGAGFDALRTDMVDLRPDMNNGITEMRAKFDLTAAGQQHITKLIQTVIDGHDNKDSA